MKTLCNFNLSLAQCHLFQKAGVRDAKIATSRFSPHLLEKNFGEPCRFSFQTAAYRSSVGCNEADVIEHWSAKFKNAAAIKRLKAAQKTPVKLFDPIGNLLKRCTAKTFKVLLPIINEDEVAKPPQRSGENPATNAFTKDALFLSETPSQVNVQVHSLQNTTTATEQCEKATTDLSVAVSPPRKVIRGTVESLDSAESPGPNYLPERISKRKAEDHDSAVFRKRRKKSKPNRASAISANVEKDSPAVQTHSQDLLKAYTSHGALGEALDNSTTHRKNKKNSNTVEIALTASKPVKDDVSAVGESFQQLKMDETTVPVSMNLNGQLANKNINPVNNEIRACDNVVPTFPQDFRAFENANGSNKIGLQKSPQNHKTREAILFAKERRESQRLAKTSILEAASTKTSQRLPKQRVSEPSIMGQELFKQEKDISVSEWSNREKEKVIETNPQKLKASRKFDKGFVAPNLNIGGIQNQTPEINRLSAKPTEQVKTASGQLAIRMGPSQVQGKRLQATAEHVQVKAAQNQEQSENVQVQRERIQAPKHQVKPLSARIEAVEKSSKKLDNIRSEPNTQDFRRTAGLGSPSLSQAQVPRPSWVCPPPAMKEHKPNSAKERQFVRLDPFKSYWEYHPDRVWAPQPPPLHATERISKKVSFGKVLPNRRRTRSNPHQSAFRPLHSFERKETSAEHQQEYDLALSPTTQGGPDFSALKHESLELELLALADDGLTGDAQHVLAPTKDEAGIQESFAQFMGFPEDILPVSIGRDGLGFIDGSLVSALFPPVS